MAATKHAQAIKQDSQTYLTTALLQLLQTKDLTEITIAQVVRRAGVSRMAFYRNYTTLDDILLGYFRPQVTARFNDVMLHVPTDTKLNALDSFFTELAGTLHLAVEHGFEHIIRQVFAENMVAFYDQTMQWGHITPTQQKYWKSFMSAGVYTIWREWLIGGQQESLNEIHTIISDFQTGTLQALKQS